MSHNTLMGQDEPNIPIPITLFFLLLPLIVLLSNRFKYAILSKSDPPLPPGPFAWPIVGNIIQIGRSPHIALANFAKTYGPLFSVKLGTKLVVVGSSPAIAVEILKTHDRNLSARFIPHVAPAKCLGLYNYSIGWIGECNGRWKYLRTVARTELFSGRAIDSQGRIRDQRVKEMLGLVGKMQGKVVKVREIAFATVLNMLSNIMVSRDIAQFEHESLNGGICRIMRDITDVASTPNVSDLYPLLGPLDLQRLQKRSMDMFDTISKLWEPIVQERKQEKTKDRPSDFLDALIENGFSQDHINVLFAELFVAGTETSSSTIEWTMTELIKNPRCMKILKEELRREIGQDCAVKESDLPKLTYLQACLKEILRLHPAGPLLLPHRASESCTIMNYTIPKDSQILVNVWAIGRDASNWEDPLEFKPERFLNLSLDFKGSDFEYFPFGSGRRICPGMPMAAKQIPLIVASFIHSFAWSLPQGMDPEDIDMTEKYGLAMRMKEPLLLVPKAKM